MNEVTESHTSTTFMTTDAIDKFTFIPEFGGQGISYWTELQQLFAASNTGMTRVFIEKASRALLDESSSDEARASIAFETVIDVHNWLQSLDVGEAPLNVSPDRVFFSMPLLVLTQCANYLNFLETAGVSHESVVKHSTTAIGHSQGIVSAVIFSAAKTAEDIIDLGVSMLRYMFWQGLRTQETYDLALTQYKRDGIDIENAGPMLAVRGLKKKDVLQAIENAQCCNKSQDLHLSLINASDIINVTGLPATLVQLKQTLEGQLANPDANQTRIPHSQRKPTGSLSFLPLSAPFHTPLLTEAKHKVVQDVQRIKCVIKGSQLQVPVYTTNADATNLQTVDDVLHQLINLQLLEPLDWMATWTKIAQHHLDATHILEFGPDLGVAKLSSKTAEGLGIHIVIATEKHPVVTSAKASSPLLGRDQFLKTVPTFVPDKVTWESKFGPRVTESGQLVNQFTRALKKPPVMVAGMTPTTSLEGIDLVAAIQNAGFHGELAAGGLSRPQIFEDTVNALVSKIKPGLGIAINMLYLNAKQWGFQFPMVLRLRRNGVPIESITVGAGIPTKDRALEMLSQLEAVGIKMVCFKPGSVDGIYAVLEIAESKPSMTVMLQWTGGRAGGHHSFEDFHMPMEETYAAIRRVSNVLLVVGSGFGNWQDSKQYLTGDWSLARGHAYKMPMDGILMGSRMMVAKEAATAPEVKKLLVDTPGIESELEWESSYTGVVGGVMTVTSELGEAIHVVANRCALLWKEFDDKFFSIPREQVELALRLNKRYIISRLNADYQKPYFGCKRDVKTGESVPADLEEMTYGDVLARLIDLMYVEVEGQPHHWVHETYFTRVSKFITRTEERLRRESSGKLFDQSELNTKPRETFCAFIAKYPQTVTTLLSVQDCDFFLDLCRTGGKPVNFVPVIDLEFKMWFKKDSLWYSEDLDAVPGRDAQRVFVLQGPVAVRYSTKVDEPVADILGGIAAGFANVVRESGAIAGAAITPAQQTVDIANVKVVQSQESVEVLISTENGTLPPADEWLASIAASVSHKKWLHELISSTHVVEGKKWLLNPVRQLLVPQIGQKYVFNSSGIRVYDSSIDISGPVIEISKKSANIAVVVNEVRPAVTGLQASTVALELTFQYHPELSCSIHAEGSGFIDKVKAFYARFWVAIEGKEEESCKAACDASVLTPFTADFAITKADIVAYRGALGLNDDEEGAPADFSTIVAWRPLIQSVFTKEVKGNLLDLVHLKHSYKLLSSRKVSATFLAGDDIVSTSNVGSLRIIDSGKIVHGIAIISRKTVDERMEEVLEPLVELHSEFLIRGTFTDFESTFSIDMSQNDFVPTRQEDVEILKAKSWLKLASKASVHIGDHLIFKLTTKKQYASISLLKSLEVSGSLFRDEAGSMVKLGTVDFNSHDVNESPVEVFLRQVQPQNARGSGLFENGGSHMLAKPLEIHVPANALAYAVASRDLNPIHRSKYAAILGHLPNGKPIMHGLWTATKVRDLVIQSFGLGFDSNVVDYDVNFDGMVYPGDTLFMQARHIGMHTGKKILSIEVVNESGERVVSARAVVKQAPMAFVFTGQGSAAVGMGMDRYQESSVARDIWNRGDSHLRKTFGFSILEMVRKNPQSITVHFGGKKGRAIREKYMSLTCEDPITGEIAPLLPEINVRTQSFSFSAPEGLLFATQFSQPALVLLEKAMFSEIEAAHLIPDDAHFAGHSLGEYAGLSSFAGALAVEDVVEVVFLRGLIMQKAVKRDADGRSDYGMVAINPTRVGPHFTEEMMHQIVDGIEAASGKLLQVVNFNIQQRQYVVAGENVNLETLSLALSAFKTLATTAAEDVTRIIADALTQARARKEKCDQSGRPIILTRGLATIPLVGIDVPFHSRELLGGVPSFRSLLRTKFDPHVLERQLPLLVNRYIPNLVATPFSLKRSYFEEVYAATKSPYLEEVLDPMQWKLTSKAQLAHLLVVELLAYQFASPVQWIKTQALLFAEGGVRRFVEIGPAPTLTNMALRTLQVGDFPNVPREILWYQRDREAVHFEEERTYVSASEYARGLIAEAEAATASLTSDVVADASLVPVTPSVVIAPEVAAPVHNIQPSLASSPAPADAPVTALHVLRVLLAVRLNKKLAEITEDTDVKTLCAGKSAVQNEILGDLEKEFGGGFPEGAGEVPLKELAASFPGYSSLGKVSNGLINKVVASKMPGGFTMSSVKEYLGTEKALGAGRMESVLAHSLLLAPQTRLKNDTDARKWLDESISEYASFAGVSLDRPSLSATFGMAFNPAPVSIPTVSDKPVEAKHALQVMLAAKFGKAFAEINDTVTIKELAAGKSAVQNEVIGDLEKEFGSIPDDAAEMKVGDLASKFSNYASPGKVLSALIAKMLASKMPGGFGLTAVKEYLSTERCLPSSRIESALLHGLTQNPKQRLSDDTTAKQWLNGVVDDYAKYAGIDIPYFSKLGGVMTGSSVGQQAMQSSSLPSEFDKRLKSMIADQIEALSSYMGDDPLDWHRKVETEAGMRENLEMSMSQWVIEHGDIYSTGIKSKFDAKKERQYDSYWNWAVQDALELYYRTAAAAKGLPASPKLAVNEGLSAHFEAMTRYINKNVDTIADESALPPLEWFKPYLCNRATPELLQCTKFFVSRAEEETSPELAQAVQLLVEQVEEWLNTNPVNMQIFKPMQPQLLILDTGELEYLEVPREGVTDSINYVDEVARGLEYNDAIESGKVAGSDVTAIMTSAVGFESTLNDNGSMSSDELDSEDDDEFEDGDSAVDDKLANKIKTVAPAEGAKLNALRDSLRKRAKRTQEKSLVARSSSLRFGLNENLKKIVLPHVHIRKPSDVDPTIRLYDVESTCVLLSCMREMASTGISFVGKVALLTGCGKNSIGAEIVKALLEGGATVFVTTSSFSMKSTELFREIYEQHGSRGSRLIVLPFNQASKVDVQSLIAHIYDVHKLDLDFLIPFAALSEVGRTITDIDSRSELAHRIMLTNTVRLVGEVVTAKKARNIATRPALVILPMSPNHGNFGGDGLYAESKLGVESLMNKWYSEGWEDQLSIVGAIIGWTRGTGLMSGNNVVAAGVEKLGMRTFKSPIFADLTGGMAQVSDLKEQVDTIRADIMEKSRLRASNYAALEKDKQILSLPSNKPVVSTISKTFAPRANMSSYYCDTFPKLSGVAGLSASTKQALLRGMVDLRQVVVVAGFGEVSPWGNSRTRWEMESYGEFSLEGCIELAWLTGRIVFDKGNWLDAKTKEIVPEHQIKSRYEEDIIEHSGIRIVEPALFNGYDPKKKMVLHQVAIDKKMSPIEVADREEALQFRKELGEENVDMFQNASGAWMIRLRKGSILNIPRALDFDRFVAGQIPTGWSVERLGLSKDLAESLDPITLYVLSATMETFVAAGVTDPYEFYQYVHVSEVGNTSGGGMGGMRAFTQIYKNRVLGKPAPSDALQECFINSPPAWVNMLLLSSSGPIKTPVGACATAAESVDIGVETIKSGKARVCIVGGYDDFGEEGAYEFAQMKATSDSVKEIGMGREPKEMCRPCSTTRGGFMESHGAGIQLLMDAQLALEMGLPIYGIVALVNTATDKNGRSIPAPGQGLLTTARETLSDNAKPSPLLDIEYRRRQFDDEIENIEKWYARERSLTNGDESSLAFLEEVKARKVQSAQSMWSDTFYHGRIDIAPLRGALNAWNLSIDDIGASSFHGTGTTANDKNESEVTHKQMAHLGRSPGNPLPVICQKSLTGHPKGAAAAWMLNGLLQVLNTGLIPGNRHLDNTCEMLRKYDHLVYPNRTYQTVGLKAVMMKSFGFGQAGGEVVLVHPDYLLSTLLPDEFQHYSARREQRMIKMNTYAQKVITGKHLHIQVKNEAPYSSAQESNVYLDPMARAEYDATSKTWRFGGADSLTAEANRRLRAEKRAKKAKAAAEAASSSKKLSKARQTDSSSTLLTAINQAATNLGLASKNMGMGVDVEPIATFENLNGREDFIRRNFTDQETAYCYSAPHPAASFAGRWAAKEAVIKAISSAAPTESNLWQGAGAPLREIEIFITASGAPSVLLSGYPLQVFNRLGLSKLSVSISHSGDFAVSQAIANFQHE
ncbi:fatty acid synthase subunit [Plasmopara halstedii]|uniref:Fatty acid synthase subunit alpha n=1 Tax=Plasmopara halstedii TaxID=4781 RepID=A0A0P1AJV5_PLAHL|nr:fatty acid synthase subunit [Plasmopara halstedii]CEG41510.1 fatty acid synthase subunit [Plasmopara halstedii]|eukprot:XP_024577879.1 fatty acid synthase subunit [Plasmopara halstedii]